jgi:hypothetical protein
MYVLPRQPIRGHGDGRARRRPLQQPRHGSATQRQDGQAELEEEGSLQGLGPRVPGLHINIVTWICHYMTLYLHLSCRALYCILYGRPHAGPSILL